MQKVKVLLTMCGDYSAFHEISFIPEYDLTNELVLSNSDITSSEEANAKHEKEYEGVRDTEIVDAILCEGRYYFKL